MKNILKNFAAVGFFLLVQTAEAQNQIDLLLEKCRASVEGKTNAGCAACLKASRESWEEEIERNYKAVMTASGDQEKQLLKAMHNNWVKYKESRFKYLEGHYGEASGKASVILEEKKMEMVKDYAREMKNMLNTFQSGKFPTGAYN